MKESRRLWCKRFFAPISGFKWAATIISIRAIQVGLQGSIVAIAMQQMIDGLAVGNMKIVYTWLVVMGVVFALSDLPAYFFRQLSSTMGWSIESNLWQEYIVKYAIGDNNSFESLGTWRINNIISKWLPTWRLNLQSLFWSAIRMWVSIITWFVVVAINLWRKGFVTFVVIFIASFIFIQFANKKLAKYRKERRDLSTELDRNTTRMIMSKFEILQNNKLGYESDKIDSFFRKIYKMRTRESRKMLVTFDLQKFTFTILRIGIMFYVIVRIWRGEFTVGDLALFRMILNQIYGSIMDLNDYITSFHQDNIYIQKLRDTFDNIPSLIWYNEWKKIELSVWDVELQNITYGYGKGEVLKDFSLTLEWWKKTALVGISGSGKSTLIKLIAGYIHPQKGEVLIDWQPLPNETNKNYVSLKSYYKHIGYLTQEPNVFDGTIYENLTYALDHEPSQEELEQAINGAQCQFIYEFPDGVQTEIGEKGVKLSWGQRQRLAIAKVMLKNPQIILLDEPTSALDSFSEEEVTKAFNNLFQWRTVVVIAHRLQTVKKADRIIVLDHGKIVEEGNHDSLVKSGGVYAKMLELQSGF